MVCVFHITGVEEHHQQRFVKINTVLNDLSAMRVSEVAASDGDRTVPKVVWKIRCYIQGIIYRTVELTQATAHEWNNGNHLASIILARSVLETTAVVHDFSRRLQDACENRKVTAIDDLVMSHTFSGKIFKSIEGIEKLKSISDLIDRIDQHLFSDKQKKTARNLYDTLSEITHPNYAGVVGFYGQLDQKNYLKTFAAKHQQERLVISHVIAGVGCIELIKMFIDTINKLEPMVWSITESNEKCL